MSEPSEVRQALDEVEDYRQTVKALLAFAAFVVHDGNSHRRGSHFAFGRRMVTSTTNRVSPGTQVTPDLVAQKSPDFGIVAEAKKSLPLDQARWRVYLEQLRKYDDELHGWWTHSAKIPVADSALLIHISRSRPFRRFVEQLAAEEGEENTIGANTSLIEFNSSEETASYFFFRLEHGAIRDDELNQRLGDGVSVPLDKILQSFPTVKYYDTEPPMALLLSELWMDTFPAMLEEAEYDEQHTVFNLSATVEEVTRELQAAYGSGSLEHDERSVEFPQQKWIRRAFEKLVELRMATPPTEKGGAYRVLFKPLRGDVLERFIKLDLGTREREGQKALPDPTQISLFGNGEDER